MGVELAGTTGTRATREGESKTSFSLLLLLMHMISTIAAQETALGMIPSHDQHHRSTRSCSWDDSFTWSAPSQHKELLWG
jgi:hypothetical protein